jgi:hypothetical protein
MIDHKFDTFRSRDPDAGKNAGRPRAGEQAIHWPSWRGSLGKVPMAAATIRIALHAQPTEGFPG